jgi:hypothetical protein
MAGCRKHSVKKAFMLAKLEAEHPYQRQLPPIISLPNAPFFIAFPLSTMSSNHHIPRPSLLLTVKILVPASRKDEFLSHMRPAFDAAMAQKECCYFILGNRDTELKGFIEGGEHAEFEGNEKGEEAVEVWWTEGWRIEGESGEVKGWKEGAEWLMNVSTNWQLPSMECSGRAFPKVIAGSSERNILTASAIGPSQEGLLQAVSGSY